MSKLGTTLLGCGLALLLFFAGNLLANASLRTLRIDLTEENLYTLSEGSKRIVSDLEEPVRLYLYVSDRVASEVPSFGTYATRVREVLEEFTLVSDGNLVLEVIDPEPFSEEEDRAVGEGLYGVPLSSGDSFFFGLVGTNAVGDSETIRFFDPTKERFLEYDLSRLIWSLANPDPPVVGLLSYLPLQGGAPNPMTGQRAPRWGIVTQLEQLFDVRILGPDLTEVPEDVSVLMLVHPRGLPPAAKYAIDQYVLGGGKTLVFVDPHCENDRTGDDPSNPMASMGTSKASELDDLLAAWGVELVANKVVGDREKAMRVQTRGSGGTVRDVDYVVYLDLDDENVDQEDAVTSLLTSLRFATAGSLEPTADATSTLHPLVWTSEESMLIDVGMVQFRPDPETMLASFVPDYERLTLAARLTGEIESAFPDGDPQGEPEAEPQDGEDDESEPAEDGGRPHRARSEGSINVIVVADADMLSDRFWIQEERLFGQISLGYRKTADNGDLAFNAVENLSGGDDLISIRAQGRFSRPFERVDEIQQEAQQRYLQEEQELERRLATAQQRINELQREKSPDDAMILSPEQEEERRRAQEEVLETRRRLRDVKHNLRKDIERLGTQLKLLNTFAVPLLVIVLAVGLAIWRFQQRTR